MDRLTLVINTAEKHVQFVLAEGGVSVCSQTWLARQGGTEILVPAIRDALKKTGHAFGDLARIACTAGPGNFTGLRIGITTASGLARAT
ncbi:MAG: tRNA (adenosine(37)-N6)-threonylcarbamoyltransferase complex dimerization subunit type 1 TsaB, partial [Mailhella sp.]|nr:tRNA (adenosine(37)-N6)-threonylcarbamoyltransferase complex dimerization subunit type 1 TsaB [Mailhella sp.]